MDKEKKNRSGSQSNNGNNQSTGERKRTSLPGAPNKSNRQTGDHEKDDSSRGAERNTKKGANNI